MQFSEMPCKGPLEGIVGVGEGLDEYCPKHNMWGLVCRDLQFWKRCLVISERIAEN